MISAIKYNKIKINSYIDLGIMKVIDVLYPHIGEYYNNIIIKIYINICTLHLHHFASYKNTDIKSLSLIV